MTVRTSPEHVLESQKVCATLQSGALSLDTVGKLRAVPCPVGRSCMVSLASPALSLLSPRPTISPDIAMCPVEPSITPSGEPLDLQVTNTVLEIFFFPSISPRESCCPGSLFSGHEEAGRKVPQMTFRPDLFPFRGSPRAESVLLQRILHSSLGLLGTAGHPHPHDQLEPL